MKDATREKPIEDMRRRMRALLARVGHEERLLVGYAQVAQYMASLGLVPAGRRAGVYASKWTVRRWLRRLDVRVLDGFAVRKATGLDKSVRPGRYTAVTNVELLGAIFAFGRWPIPRERSSCGSDAPTPGLSRPLPPPEYRFTHEGWRRYGRPGRRADG